MDRFGRNPSQRGGYYDNDSRSASPNSASASLLSPGSNRDSNGSSGHGNYARTAFSRGPASIQSNGSTGSFANTRYGAGPGLGRQPSMTSSISDKFSLSPDPVTWGTTLNQPEPDDNLHNPDASEINEKGHIFTARGIQNLGCIFLLLTVLVGLFAGYPLVSHFLLTKPISLQNGFNLGGINASGQVPSMNGNWGLIDLETPKEMYTIKSYHDPTQDMQLVFSDEFNTDNRTFYPGDDPYWEAVDLHYYSTNNLEWYDPSAITTKGGALRITMTNEPIHGLDYKSGMMSTWNKFCFSGGLIVTSVTLPGISNVAGFWPAIWTMGNLGRAGYGASLEGMWPYTYDFCDVGAVANQTINGQPLAATIQGDTSLNGGALSYLPGQRLSRCTCPGESHPGPIHEDGTYVGRSAPEIDIFEAQITGTSASPKAFGQVSQSAQWAPFNQAYDWTNTSTNMIIYDTDITSQNSYTGGAFQQATSGVSTTDQDCYELGTGCFSVYGFEYQAGYNDAYISWISNNKLVWTMLGAGMAADNRVEINARQVPAEPMYILVNLGMSRNFGTVDTEHLQFPATMSVDYVRVYQHKDQINVGCDPPNFPTASYINEYIEAYTNPNITTWTDDFKQPFPKNSFLKEC